MSEALVGEHAERETDTHKWTIFLASAATPPPAPRSSNEPPPVDMDYLPGGADDLQYLVKRVVFRLHETYPNPNRSVLLYSHLTESTLMFCSVREASVQGIRDWMGRVYGSNQGDLRARGRREGLVTPAPHQAAPLGRAN